MAGIIATWLFISVNYCRCHLWEHVKRKPPILKIHQLARACIIATWLLYKAFVVAKAVVPGDGEGPEKFKEFCHSGMIK